MKNSPEYEDREKNFQRFKKFFLLEITKELIRNSAPSDILKLETIVEKQKEEQINEVKEKIKEREQKAITNAIEIHEGEIKAHRSIMHPSVGMFGNQEIPHINPFKEAFRKKKTKKSRFIEPFKRAELYMPESNFPPHLQYLKPIPMNRDIELGKLDPLIEDPMVNIIECHGPEENIMVQGRMGLKKTGIVLDKEEIDIIIQRFSRDTKIPVQEGVYRVVSGRLIFTAIISELVGSKFTIKKMIP